MEENEMDRVKQRYTELANALGELSGLLDSLKKTIHKIEGLRRASSTCRSTR